MQHFRIRLPGLLAATLLVLCSARSASAQLGGQLYGTGGAVTVEVLPATAGYVSELGLYAFDGTSYVRTTFIALNTDVGTVVNLGTFPAGQELVFGIYVRNTGITYLMGPASRNPDGIEHAVVTAGAPGQAVVGFEDLFGGGDRDYDDNVFKFTGVIPDVTPPTITDCSVNPGTLWPPNHQMVDVTVGYNVTDNQTAAGDIVCSLSVSSNEPVNGTGDGDTAPDWEVVDAHHVRLRAERSGKGAGRVYTITISCTDASGNTATKTCTVSVAHDQR